MRLPRRSGAATARAIPTFIEIGTNRPLYVHRRGSNVVNGEYYADYNPAQTLGHYGRPRKIDVAALRREYETLKATPPEVVAKDSPLLVGAQPLPRYFLAAMAQDLRSQHRQGRRRRRDALVAIAERAGLVADPAHGDQPSLHAATAHPSRRRAISAPPMSATRPTPRPISPTSR